VRIIAGEHRGRRVEAPRGRSTRPMLDRVREALFGTLGDLVPDARVLDLFAGSGSLGLEALSRGARLARMIERDPETLRVLQRNVAALGLAERAEVARGDALDPHLWPAGRGRPGQDPAGTDPAAAFDLAFLDPPYALLEDPAGRARLFERLERLLREALGPGGVLVLHAPRRTAEALKGEHPGWDLRVYGSSGLLYVRRAVERAADAASVGDGDGGDGDGGDGGDGAR
jgi:16S rRNA (guanine966-N2)-methyltransferase